MKEIYVTQPSLPSLDEYIPYLESIWDSKIVTNGGRYHKELEDKLCEFLGVEYISLFCNGTTALITAMKALNVKNEVITTPYSFVASTHSLIWNNLTPIFVDIDPATGNLDPEKVEKAITPETSAILGVHVYGQPCDNAKLQKIADKYNLKLIYDAAHAFGVNDKEGSVLRYGDLSALSFHATKAFNTIEGGAIVSKDKKTKEKIDFLKNFGFENEISVLEVGINGKMNELMAALGLVQLKHFKNNICLRQQIDKLYRAEIENIKGIRAHYINPDISWNYSYFPIYIDDDYHISRDELYEKFKANNIFARRYFYPSISSFEMYKDYPSAHKSNLPIAYDLSSRVLCLPIYPNLSFEDQKRIIGILK